MSGLSSVQSSTLLSRAKVGLALLFLAIFMLSFFIRLQTFFQLAMDKHLTADLKELEQLGSYLGPGDILFISDVLGRHPFMVSRWLAYLLRDIPVVYNPNLHRGGYLFSLEVDYDKNLKRATHMLRARSESDGEPDSRVIFRNSKYEVVSLDNFAFFTSGFFGIEQWGGGWMSQEATLRIRTHCRGYIQIPILGKFEIGPSEIHVTSNLGRSSEFTYPGEIRFPTSDKTQELHLVSTAKAVSPAELGISIDSRKLTFSLGSPKIVCTDDARSAETPIS